MSNIYRLRNVLHDIGLRDVELDWEVVTILVRLKGLTMKQVAIDAGMHPTTLAQTKYRNQLPQQQVIADALGVVPAELWPNRYRAHDFNLSRVNSTEETREEGQG